MKVSTKFDEPMAENAPEWAMFSVQLDGTTYFGWITKGLKYIWQPCSRCGGQGRLPYAVYGGICYQCRGVMNRITGQAGRWEELQKSARRIRRNLRARERRQEKLQIAEVSLREEMAFRWANLVTAHPPLREMRDLAEDAHPVVKEMRQKFERYGCLSEAQVSLARKLIRETHEKRAAQSKPRKVVVAPLGKQTIAGTVVALKERVNSHCPYGSTVWSWMVESGQGWMVWSTVPKVVLDHVRVGDSVTFVAELVEGWDADDKSLVRGLRPSKAQIIPAQ